LDASFNASLHRQPLHYHAQKDPCYEFVRAMTCHHCCVIFPT
jgi:hypothetical protein